jgi:hypothetical protein
MNAETFQIHALPRFGLALSLPSAWRWNAEHDFFIDSSLSARLSVNRTLVKGDVWRNEQLGPDAHAALTLKQLARTDPHMVIMGTPETLKAINFSGFIMRLSGIRGPSFNPQNRVRSSAVLVCLQTPVNPHKSSLGTALIELRLDLVAEADASLEASFFAGLHQSQLHPLETGSLGDGHTAGEKSPLLNRVLARLF